MHEEGIIIYNRTASHSQLSQDRTHTTKQASTVTPESISPQSFATTTPPTIKDAIPFIRIRHHSLPRHRNLHPGPSHTINRKPSSRNRPNSSKVRSRQLRLKPLQPTQHQQSRLRKQQHRHSLLNLPLLSPDPRHLGPRRNFNPTNNHHLLLTSSVHNRPD